ncbi:MAG: hypothetical protein JNG88_09555 [Phycisphaerales bacterium]|nr:hypothetical protein [Phycisphaerales bacterium]
MASEEIRDLLESDPFVPFRVRLSSGDHYDVADSRLAVMLKSRLFIAFPRSDRSVYVPYPHIAAVEVLHDSRARRGRRGNGKH